MSSPGVFTEVIHLFLARTLTAVPTRAEDHEVIEVHWFPWSEALHMAQPVKSRCQDPGRLLRALKWIFLCSMLSKDDYFSGAVIGAMDFVQAASEDDYCCTGMPSFGCLSSEGNCRQTAARRAAVANWWSCPARSRCHAEEIPRPTSSANRPHEKVRPIMPFMILSEPNAGRWSRLQSAAP